MAMFTLAVTIRSYASAQRKYWKCNGGSVYSGNPQINAYGRLWRKAVSWQGWQCKPFLTNVHIYWQKERLEVDRDRCKFCLPNLLSWKKFWKMSYAVFFCGYWSLKPNSFHFNFCSCFVRKFLHIYCISVMLGSRVEYCWTFVSRFRYWNTCWNTLLNVFVVHWLHL